MKWQAKLDAARLMAIRKARYFATGILSMQVVEFPAAKTMGVTDRGVLLVNPAYVDESTVRTLAGDWVHEWCHLWMFHGKRRGEREPQKWNVVCDASIFHIVDDLGLEQPDFSITPAKLGLPRNRTPEEYYDLLEDEPENTRGGCGSGAGNPFEGEPQTAGRSTKEVERAARTVAEAVRAAPPGGVPDGARLWADLALAPAKVSWQTKLGHAVRTSSQWRPGAVKRTFRRISRRQAGVGWGVGAPVLAARYRPVPRVALALDTSASMGAAEIRAAVSEAAGVLAAVGGKALFLACDCEVHEQREVASVAELIASIKGGGGTSFVPIFDALGAMKQQPEIVVVATDGGGYAPAAPPPGMRVIWLLVGAHRVVPSFPGERWGTMIEVD